METDDVAVVVAPVAVGVVADRICWALELEAAEAEGLEGWGEETLGVGRVASAALTKAVCLEGAAKLNEGGVGACVRPDLRSNEALFLWYFIINERPDRPVRAWMDQNKI